MKANSQRKNTTPYERRSRVWALGLMANLFERMGLEGIVSKKADMPY